MRYQIVLIAGFLILSGLGTIFTGSGEAGRSPGQWTTKAPLQDARSGAAVVALNGMIYVIGGENASEQLSQVLVYDPANDTWSQAAPMLKTRDRFSAVAAGGLIYAINGNHNYDTTVEAYSPQNNTWWYVPDTPRPHLLGAAAEANGIIYAVGGWPAVSYVHAYNPANNTWWEVASLGTGAQCFAAAGVNGTVYAIGATAMDSMVAYDPASNSWSACPNMPTGRTMPAAVSVGNRYLVAVGGGIPEGGAVSGGGINKTEVYDTFTKTWSAVSDMPTGRYDLGAARAGSSLYAIGGETTTGGKRILSENDALDVSDMLDNIPPGISVTGPTGPTYLNTADATIFGSTTDNWGVKKIESSLDGISWTPCTGTTSWSATLTLNNGTNNISIRATDVAGNINTTYVLVVRDAASPAVTIAAPKGGIFVPNATISVSGTATDAIGVGKVEISRDQASWTLCTGTSSWNATLVLVKGSNTIYARATDKAGNTNQSTIQISLDDELPTVSITSPSAGAQTSKSTLTVKGTAADNVQLLKVEISTDGTVWSPVAGNSSWSGSVKLKEGRNTISVKATDGVGNVRTVSADVTYKAAKSTPGFEFGIGLMALVVAGLVSAMLRQEGKRRR